MSIDSNTTGFASSLGPGEGPPPRSCSALVRRARLVLFALALAASVGCTSKPEESPKKERAASSNAHGESASTEEVVAASPVVIPDGPAGPFEFTTVNGNWLAFGGGAATRDAFIAVHRFEVRNDPVACPLSGTAYCDPWLAVLGMRTESKPGSPPASPNLARASVAESDTPSGIEIAAVEAVGDRFAVVWREGRYTEDVPKLTLTWLDAKGATAQVTLFEGDLGVELGRATAAATGADSLMVCWSGSNPDAKPAIELLADTPIWCRSTNLQGKLSPIKRATSQHGNARSPSLAWGAAGGGLLTWVRDGNLEAAAIDAEGVVSEPALSLGPALAKPAQLAAGHGGFLVAWQDGAGEATFARLDPPATLASAPLRFEEGSHHLLPSGVAAVPEGFVVGFNTSAHGELALLDPLVQKVLAPLRPMEPTALVWVKGFGVFTVDPAKPAQWKWGTAASLFRPVGPTP